MLDHRGREWQLAGATLLVAQQPVQTFQLEAFQDRDGARLVLDRCAPLLPLRLSASSPMSVTRDRRWSQRVQRPAPGLEVVKRNELHYFVVLP
jgi:hypothetical protein